MIKGIIHITGEHDTGKTYASLGLYHPKEVVFFHDDVKLPPIDKKEFGEWVNVAKECNNMTLLETTNHILNIIKRIKANQYKCIIFDTWSRFGEGLRAWAKLNVNELREPDTMAKQAPYVYGQIAGEANLYEAKTISKLSELAQTIILVTHLNDHYESGAKTGKQIPNAGKSFERVCNLRLWLRHNQHSANPIGLVLKRISKAQMTNKGVIPTNVLPRKITPLDIEQTIWQSIERYWKDPVGNRQPTEDETPNSYELSILDGILTEDQKQVWMTNIGQQKTMIETIRTMPDNMSLIEVKKALGDQYSLDEIRRYRNE